jgi:putative membrane protein
MSDRIYVPLIAAVSVLIPLVVALLLFAPSDSLVGTVDVSFLPLLNACINSAVTVLLIAGLVFIRRRNKQAHKTAMISAVILSVCFLVSYVIYHAATQSTSYGGDGPLQYVYYFILITHILLAIAVVPLVLLTLYRAIRGQFHKHRKIARWTFPIWLYVSVTGVLVYLMISPYY